VPDACAQAVAHQVAYQPGLVVNDLQGTLMTIWDAQSAPVAFIFINPYYLSFHIRLNYFNTNLD
jgi:hypothetical protein